MADILSPKTKVEASHVPERPDEAGGQPQVDNGASATIEPSLQPDPAETHPADSVRIIGPYLDIRPSITADGSVRRTPTTRAFRTLRSESSDCNTLRYWSRC